MSGGRHGKRDRSGAPASAPRRLATLGRTQTSGDSSGAASWHDRALTKADPWRPSEYTGFLIHTLETEARHLVRGSVLELGIGSGVVLGALAALGAQRLVGTDIDPSAIDEASGLMQGSGVDVELLVGDLWEPLEGRRFDLVVANPPHFPTTKAYPGRPPTWSQGGADGRRIMDPLLLGLRTHLAEGGHAVLMHSGFLGLHRTCSLLASQGLRAQRLASMLMPLASEKREVMAPELLERADRESLRRIGKYDFLVTDILDISSSDIGRR